MTRNTTIGPLSERERADLVDALEDEYLARATYAQVLEDFGEVRPFSHIVHAEGRHAEALKEMFERYGVPVPDDTSRARAPRYESLGEACAAAASAEVENAALYDRLLSGTERRDLLDVYTHLREASQERHLPAFQRCVERGHRGGRPPNTGGRARRRQGNDHGHRWRGGR